MPKDPVRQPLPFRENEVDKVRHALDDDRVSETRPFATRHILAQPSMLLLDSIRFRLMPIACSETSLAVRRLIRDSKEQTLAACPREERLQVLEIEGAFRLPDLRVRH